MRRTIIAVAATVLVLSCVSPVQERRSHPTGEMLSWHEIRVDDDNFIVPWNYDAPSVAYDDIIDRLWAFWDTMRVDANGLRYDMNHLVWKPGDCDERGIAGDQVAMMVSSWMLLYPYLGENRVMDNMTFMAGYYLAHSLSPADCKWPSLPYPQNLNLFSGEYDGDMMLGKYFLQPDKAASFALELFHLSEVLGRPEHRKCFLDAAVKIADVLAERIREGDADRSPWPFRVNAMTGEIGSEYTSNFTPAIELFFALSAKGVGNVALYEKAADRTIDWLREYPEKLNKWGPFFEDVAGWSETQTNAVTYAQFLMNHADMFPDWQPRVRSIFKWVYDTLGNHEWDKYGVTVINEQTHFQLPGNSHSARQACAELQYVHMTGDSTYYDSAVRKLNWATYMVNEKGWNTYYGEIWISDGYGDYVRHYLRAMDYCPELAPANEPHILCSHNPGLYRVCYKEDGLSYRSRYNRGKETVRLPEAPSAVEGVKTEDADTLLEWKYDPLASGGGLLTIIRQDASRVLVKY